MRGRRIAADYERHYVFLIFFITNAADARPTRGRRIMPFIVGRNASAARRPHVANLASDRRDHFDASAAMRRPLVGRNAADYVLTLKLEILKITVDTCFHVNLEL